MSSERTNRLANGGPESKREMSKSEGKGRARADRAVRDQGIEGSLEIYKNVPPGTHDATPRLRIPHQGWAKAD